MSERGTCPFKDERLWVEMKIPVAFEGIPASDRPRSQKTSTVTLLSLTHTSPVTSTVTAQ
jgi:hypothetical protein